MKNHKKTFSLFIAALGLSATLLAGAAITWSAAEAKAPYGEAFDYTQSVSPIKYKTMQSPREALRLCGDPDKNGSAYFNAEPFSSG